MRFQTVIAVPIGMSTDGERVMEIKLCAEMTALPAPICARCQTLSATAAGRQERARRRRKRRVGSPPW